MIENMILKGLGGVGMQHPTSVSYTSNSYSSSSLTLSGITKEPFCVVWAHTYSASGYSFVLSGMYLKDPTSNTVLIRKAYRRRSDASASKMSISSVTYNGSTDTLTLNLDSTLDSGNLPTKSEIYCIY